MPTGQRDRHRFRDPGEPIYSYWEEILVECPRCGGCAVVTRADPKTKGIFYARRLICRSGGMAVEKKPRRLTIAGEGAPPVDACFGLPLWLAAPCCGHTLWAYNIAHLNLIEDFVGAKLRQRALPLRRIWYRKGLVSKLPAWMTSAKDRDAVLKAIGKLRKTRAGLHHP